MLTVIHDEAVLQPPPSTTSDHRLVMTSRSRAAFSCQKVYFIFKYLVCRLIYFPFSMEILHYKVR